MPELPEVETMRRGIRAVRGARLADVSRVPCRLKPIRVTPRLDIFRRRARGRTVVSVGRRGKRVVLHLDGGDAIVIEPRMTGLVLVSDPPDPEHLRFRFDLSGGPWPTLWYWDRRGLGSIRLLTAEQLVRELGPPQLGPDALEITAPQLREALGSSRRSVKVALLDQRVVAGIGNLYASEILHLAGVHPQARCHRLSRDQWRRIHAAQQQVLHEAIRYEGSTLADGTYRNALNRAGNYQNHHRVYNRAGETCPQCGQATVRRVVLAQRATFFCPRCQRQR